MFSLIPLTPGRRVQTLRTIRSIFAPACEARYSSSMIALSLRLLTLRRIRAFFLDAAAWATLRISSISRSRRLNGATSSFWNSSGLPKPVT